jgi:hypothetical protein
MGYESYQPENIVIRYVSVVSLSSKQTTFSVFIYKFFTDLSLRLGADISKVTAHERIQHLYDSFCSSCIGTVNNDTIVFEKRKSRKISGNPSVTVLQSCSRVALESCLEIRLECNLTPREN